MKLTELGEAIDPHATEEISVSGGVQQSAGFTAGGKQAELGQKILKFANRLKTKNPGEFERMRKIVQQEAQRRGIS